jgi:hypothetical protein
MSTSLFQRRQVPTAPQPATPHELIHKEVAHLKKGKSSRYGDKPVRKASTWALVGVICVVIWLYVMDPVLHAWYKGDAIRTYVYLHYFGTSEQAAELASTGILRPDEIVYLDRSPETYKDNFASLQEAQVSSHKIIQYMNSVRKLHAGKYEKLDFIGTVRYDLFIRNGIETPTEWTSLDPVVNDGK